MEDAKDKQGGSPPLSPTCLTNIVKDIMDQPLAQKNQQSKINNQKAKASKRMAEVWQQLPEEDSNAAMAMATATGARYKLHYSMVKSTYL
jgi:hypothetical protein